MTPGIIAAGDLHDARFKVDAEPFPAQKEQGETRWRISGAQSRTKAGRREEQSDEPRLEQHAVRLVTRKILGSRDKGEKTDEAKKKPRARPEIENHCHGCRKSDPADQHQGAVAGRPPEQCWRKPEPQPAGEMLRDSRKVIGSRQNSSWANESLDLKQERIKRREVNQSQGTEKDPSCQKVVFLLRRNQPTQNAHSGRII